MNTPLHHKTTCVWGWQRHTLLLPAILLTIALLAARSSSQAGPTASDTPATGAANYTIEIKQLKYFPNVVTVHPGDTVQWKNNDIVPHTATTQEKSFDSGKIEVGGTWTLTVPAKKGDYFYTCTFHPNMKAKLVVQ